MCLEDDLVFGAIGFYYRDFQQVSDEEVIEILQRFPAGKLRKSSLAGGVNDSRPEKVRRDGILWHDRAALSKLTTHCSTFANGETVPAHGSACAE